MVWLGVNDNAVAKSLKLMGTHVGTGTNIHMCTHTQGNDCEMILYGQTGVNRGGCA